MVLYDISSLFCLAVHIENIVFFIFYTGQGHLKMDQEKSHFQDRHLQRKDHIQKVDQDLHLGRKNHIPGPVQGLLDQEVDHDRGPDL